MAKRYARGDHAVGECQRSGKKMLRRLMVEDGHIPGLIVAPEWYEPRHPLLDLKHFDDPIALYRPAPENLPGQTVEIDLSDAPLAVDLWTPGASYAWAVGDLQVEVEEEPPPELIELVGCGSAFNAEVDDNETFDVPLHDPTVAGNLVVIYLAVYDGNANLADVVSTPTGWNRATDSQYAGFRMGQSPFVAVFWRIADGNEGANVTFTQQVGSDAIRIIGKACTFENPSTTTPVEIGGMQVYADAAEGWNLGFSAPPEADRRVYRVPPHRCASSGYVMQIQALGYSGASGASFGTPAVDARASDVILANETGADGGALLVRLVDVREQFETITNLLDSATDFASSDWGVVNALKIVVPDDIPGAGYENRAVFFVDEPATTGLHGVTQDVTVTQGETYYLCVSIDPRIDGTQLVADRMLGCAVVLSLDGTDYGNYIGFYDGTTDSQEIGPAFGSGFDTFDISKGARCVHAYAIWTAPASGTATLCVYSATRVSGVYTASRAALPSSYSASADEGEENAFQVLQASMCTEGWVWPVTHERDDLLAGRTLGAGVPEADQMALQRTVLASAPNAENECTTVVTLALPNPTESGEVGSTLITQQSVIERWYRTGDGAPPTAGEAPYVLTRTRSRSAARLLRTALARNSGKWYWEVRLDRQPFGAVTTRTDFEAGLVRADWCGDDRDTHLSGSFTRNGKWSITGTVQGIFDGNVELLDSDYDNANGDISAFDDNWVGFAWDADAGTMIIYVGDGQGGSGPVEQSGSPYGNVFAGTSYTVGEYYCPFIIANENATRWIWRLTTASGLQIPSVPAGFTPWGDV